MGDEDDLTELFKNEHEDDLAFGINYEDEDDLATSMDKGKGKKTSSDEKPVKKRLVPPPDESHASTQITAEQWPDHDLVPLRSPTLSNLSSEGKWSEIQRWYQENHAGAQGLPSLPRQDQPRVEDYDEDYLRYLEDMP
nr:hypothetical protein Iba_chr14dCG1320 [Ipomoea batatas]